MKFSTLLFLTVVLDGMNICVSGESTTRVPAGKVLTAAAFAAHRKTKTFHQSILPTRSKPLTRLFMGKGFNRAKNKQAALAKKLEIARKGKENGTQNETNQNENTDDDKTMDRELFEKLLATTKGAIPSAADTESDYFSPIKIGSTKTKKVRRPNPSPKPKADKEKPPEEISQRSFFEDLIDLETSQRLGPINAAQLIPWVPPYLKDCLVVFTDPRTSSGDLRQTFKYLSSALDDRDSNGKYNDQVMFVCTESVKEMKSWLRRSNIERPLRVFSDPEMKFLSAYDLIGSETDYRWSMSMLVFDTDGKKPKVFRDVDPTYASQMALQHMEEYESKS